jgi:predicted PurR-regulated permease PerM
MTRIVRYAIIVVATLTLLLLLWQFSISIVLFLLSLAAAAALRPVINSLTGRYVPKRVALGIVYFLLIAAIAGSLLLISQPFLNDLQIASDDFVANYEHAKTDWPLHGSLFQKTLAQQLPPSTDLYEVLTNQGGIPVLQGVFGFAQNFFSTLGHIAIVIVLSLYWSADQFRFERLGLSLIPEAYHSKALHVWRSIETGVGAYLRSEIIQSVLAGMLLWLVYSMLGIRYPTLLAGWGAVARLIPWFGSLIAVIPALLIGIGVSSTVGVLATLYTIAILLTLKLVIEPRFFLRSRYSSLLIVLFVIALAETFGFIGVVLAPPLAVAVQILFQHLYPLTTVTPSTEIAEQVIDIKERLSQLKRRLQNYRNREGVRLADRLNHLADRVAEQLQEY